MSNEFNILQTAVWTVLFVVPGFIAAETKHYWMMTSARRTTEKTVESICWSFIIYFFISLIPEKYYGIEYFTKLLIDIKAPEKVLFNSLFLKYYAAVLAISWFVGRVYALIYPVKIIATYCGRTPHPRVWDEFWKMRGTEAANNGVWLELKDSTQWLGKLNSASDTSGTSEIWLTDVRRYFPDQKYISDTPYSDMLINAEKIERVFICKYGILSNALPIREKPWLIRFKTWAAKLKSENPFSQDKTS